MREGRRGGLPSTTWPAISMLVLKLLLSPHVPPFDPNPKPAGCYVPVEPPVMPAIDPPHPFSRSNTAGSGSSRHLPSYVSPSLLRKAGTCRDGVRDSSGAITDGWSTEPSSTPGGRWTGVFAVGGQWTPVPRPFAPSSPYIVIVQAEVARRGGTTTCSMYHFIWMPSPKSAGQEVRRYLQGTRRHIGSSLWALPTYLCTYIARAAWRERMDGLMHAHRQPSLHTLGLRLAG